MATQIEHRWFAGLEVRQAEGADADTATIRGYGLKWGETVTLYNRFRERFERGAFKRTIKEDDARLMIGHNYEGLPLARVSTGTMRLREDSDGLVVEADLDTRQTDASDLVRKIRRGDVDGMSVGFSMDGGKEEIESGKEKDDGSRELDLHVIKEVGKLYEVSAVTFPAYESSDLSMRRTLDLLAARAKEQSNVESTTYTDLLTARAKACAILMGVEQPKGGRHDQT